jgi:hypothetical protein
MMEPAIIRTPFMLEAISDSSRSSCLEAMMAMMSAEMLMGRGAQSKEFV